MKAHQGIHSVTLLQRISRSLSRIAVLASVSVSISGCVTDFVAPLAVASHRYPKVKLAMARAPAAPKAQVVDDEPVQVDRLPTAKEIFDLHPRGYDPERMRQPFVLNPHEGPLKISTLSRDDTVAADRLRLQQSEDVRRSTTSRPASALAIPQSTVVDPPPPVAH